MKRRYSSYNNR